LGAGLRNCSIYDGWQDQIEVRLRHGFAAHNAERLFVQGSFFEQYPACRSASSTNWPTTKVSKSISALPPQVSTMLIWSVFSGVTRPLLSHRLVVGKHPQDTLVRPLLHTSRFDRHGTVRAPFEPSTQLLDATRRAVPSVAHCRLIGDASAFAATEKPDAVVRPSSIQNARWAVACGAREHEVSPAKMCFAPIADNVLL
jgi:hypothetical protein